MEMVRRMPAGAYVICRNAEEVSRLRALLEAHRPGVAFSLVATDTGQRTVVGNFAELEKLLTSQRETIRFLRQKLVQHRRQEASYRAHVERRYRESRARDRENIRRIGKRIDELKAELATERAGRVDGAAKSD